MEGARHAGPGRAAGACVGEKKLFLDAEPKRRLLGHAGPMLSFKCTKARTEDAAVQVARLSSALSLDACSNSQHVQPSTTPYLSPHASHLSGRSGKRSADCDHCGLTDPTVRAVVTSLWFS